MNKLTQIQEYDFTAALGPDPYNSDPATLPVWIGGRHEWTQMSETQRGRILGGMLRNLSIRAVAESPYFRDHPDWQNINPKDIEDISDLINLPLISKDSVPGTGSPYSVGIHGFRSELGASPDIISDDRYRVVDIQQRANPNYKDISQHYEKRIMPFDSGGTQGKSTETWLSYLTVETEAYALARALAANGYINGDPAQAKTACFYADTHKGGKQLERAADILGTPFHAKDTIFDALGRDGEFGPAINTFKKNMKATDYPENPTGVEVAMYLETEAKRQQSLEAVAPKVRQAIREYIRRENIEIVESVQPPGEFLHKNAKGGYLSFMSIYNEDPSAFEKVRHIFLTGFPVPEWAYTPLREAGKTVSTTWGSTEAMALATHSLHLDSPNVNRLESMNFPTVGLVVKYRSRNQPTPSLEEVTHGQRGILAVTRLLPGGSIYVNYRIGDRATKRPGGLEDIQRADMTKISGGCGAEALTI